MRVSTTVWPPALISSVVISGPLYILAITPLSFLDSAYIVLISASCSAIRLRAVGVRAVLFLVMIIPERPRNIHETNTNDDTSKSISIV